MTPGGGGSMESTGGFSLRGVIEPLARSTIWMRVLAVFTIIYGVMTCLSIIGLLWGWIPIWAGVNLFGAAGAVDRAEQYDNATALHEASEKLKRFFTLAGVLGVIMVVFMLLYLVFIFAYGISALPELLETLEGM
jgi:hypothetical protein